VCANKKILYLKFGDPAHSLGTTQLLCIAELASSPNSLYQNFFFSHTDYFGPRTISLDGQNREKAFSQENGTKPIELLCFQKVICFPWIHSLIKVKQVAKELFAVPTLKNGLFSTHFLCRSHPSH